MQGRLPLVSFSPLDLWSLWFSSCCELTGGGGGGEGSAGREEERSVRGGIVEGEGGGLGGEGE